MSRVWQPATEQSAHLSPEKWALLFHTFLWPHARHTRADRKRTDAPSAPNMAYYLPSDLARTSKPTTPNARKNSACTSNLASHKISSWRFLVRM